MSKRKPVTEYVRLASVRHGGKYDYSLITYITSNKQRVPIICPQHGAFYQAMANHICAGQGCPRCGNNYRKTTEEVMSEIRAVHGDKFTYPPFTYKRNKQYIEIICPVHGSFRQCIKEHINGSGCGKCAKNAKMNTLSFIEKAREIHGDKYDYSQVEYAGNEHRVTIVCPVHGSYFQTPHCHLAGYGCSRCVANSSKKENAWLDSLHVVGLKRQHPLRIDQRCFTIDGYDPQTNTVYEFNGDYFHGNPTYFDEVCTNRLTKVRFGVLLQKTQDKQQMLEQAGYKVVSIWESEWLEQQGQSLKRRKLMDEERYVMKRAFVMHWQRADPARFDINNFLPWLSQDVKAI